MRHFEFPLLTASSCICKFIGLGGAGNGHVELRWAFGPGTHNLLLHISNSKDRSTRPSLLAQEDLSFVCVGTGDGVKYGVVQFV